jgi:hypothetical protein
LDQGGLKDRRKIQPSSGTTVERGIQGHCLFRSEGTHRGCGTYQCIDTGGCRRPGFSPSCPGFPAAAAGLSYAAAAKETHRNFLAPEVLEKYVGKYQFTPNVLITVTQKEDRFYAQLTGQQALEIFPENEREFFLKVVEAQITFETDDSGKAIAMILHQNGRNQRASKIEE